jgi:hypothetical protein
MRISESKSEKSREKQHAIDSMAQINLNAESRGRLSQARAVVIRLIAAVHGRESTDLRTPNPVRHATLAYRDPSPDIGARSQRL